MPRNLTCIGIAAIALGTGGACGSTVVIENGGTSPEETGVGGMTGDSVAVGPTTDGAGGAQTGGGAGGAGGAPVTVAQTSGQGGMMGCTDPEGGHLIIQSGQAYKPADIIFVVDNSGSMTGEIAQVEQNINVNFAQIISNSKVDYRVIMVTDHGPGNLDLCIEAPLSSIPPGGCSSIGTMPPGETQIFKHYDHEILSHNALCKLLGTFNGTLADEHNLHPQGWGSLLREEAIKIFVVLTDDGIDCTMNNNTAFNDADAVDAGKQVAIDWDKALLQMSPYHFGTLADRNYIFHSIIGVAPKDLQMPNTPWHWADLATNQKCVPGAVGPGTGYQWLSKGTHGIRYPLCPISGVQDYSVIFKDIAAGVLAATALPCSLEVPAPGPDQIFNYDDTTIIYTPGDNSPKKELKQVPNVEACGLDDDKFYIEDDKIKFCPFACETIQKDKGASVDIQVACTQK